MNTVNPTNEPGHCSLGFAPEVPPVFDGPKPKPKPYFTRSQHLAELLGRIKYKAYLFQIGTMGDGHYLQVVLDVSDVMSGNFWKGRKWYLSPHAVDAEVVSTAFKAVMTAEEHEIREQFLFDGLAIFGPHLSLEALKERANKTVTR